VSIFEENWYAEPFEKQNKCGTDGCDGEDCDCDCTYGSMSEPEVLPRIEEIAALFPDEWLAFIVPPAEDDDPAPTHGRLVAHSPHPDAIFDAANAVLWNQCVYTFFNGDFEAMEASYGDTLNDEPRPIPQPTPDAYIPMTEAEVVPTGLIDLIHSALDKLYETPPHTSEAIRRLRIAKVRAGYNSDSPLHPILDAALDGLEVAEPDIQAVIWHLEEDLSAFKTTIV